MGLHKKSRFRYFLLSGIISFVTYGVFAPLSVYAQTKPLLDLKNKKISSISVIKLEDIYKIPIANFNLGQGVDTDMDGLSDTIEMALETNATGQDTDKDSYTDKIELLGDYDPIKPQGIRPFRDTSFTEKNIRGLLLEHVQKNIFSWYVNSDDKKIYFLGTFKNLQATLREFKLSYVPSQENTEPSNKKIEVNLTKQKLSLYMDDIKLSDMIVSTGNDRGPTPTGTFKILNKSPRAWSKLAGLWMPNWMAFAKGGKYGIHELPEWPNGKKEGADHLGKKVSHGCIRLGVSDAKLLYAWAPINTKVIVKKS